MFPSCCFADVDDGSSATSGAEMGDTATVGADEQRIQVDKYRPVQDVQVKGWHWLVTFPWYKQAKDPKQKHLQTTNNKDTAMLNLVLIQALHSTCSCLQASSQILYNILILKVKGLMESCGDQQMPLRLELSLVLTSILERRTRTFVLRNWYGMWGMATNWCDIRSQETDVSNLETCCVLMTRQPEQKEERGMFLHPFQMYGRNFSALWRSTTTLAHLSRWMSNLFPGEAGVASLNIYHRNLTYMCWKCSGVPMQKLCTRSHQSHILERSPAALKST